MEFINKLIKELEKEADKISQAEGMIEDLALVLLGLRQENGDIRNRLYKIQESLK